MSVAIDYSSGAFAANKAKSVGTIAQAQAGYDIANASYDSVSFSLATQDGTPTKVSFKPDGLKMYVLGNVNDSVYQYSLSTAWDVSSASYDSVSFSVANELTIPEGLFLSPDGYRMYVVGRDTDTIFQYALSTAWDLSTVSYSNNSFSVATQEGSPRGIFIKPDGTKFYITGATGDDINEYTLSTAWNISTASYVQNFSVSSQETSPQDLFFVPDGDVVFLIGATSDAVNEYSLSTAWDISTASFVQNFSIASQDTIARGLSFKSDGTKMYVMGSATDTVFQYSTGSYVQNLDISTGNYFNYTPTANTTFTFSNAPASGTAAGFALAVTGGNAAAVYDIANASYDNKSFSTNSQDASSALVGLAFKSDGTKMYALTQNNFSVYQYSLSTAWDVSTASYDSVSFALPTGYTGLADLRFKPDGTKFYVLDSSSDGVRQYSLSTAWDLSTASNDNVIFSVQTQDSSPRVLDFKPDGTKMFYGGATSETVYEYALSTAWDVSTASYSNKSFSTATQDSQLYGMTFNSSGTKMFTGGGTNDSVFQYSLSTAWDISTASYDSVSFSVASQSGYASNLNYKTDGSKLYLSGRFTNSVFQYTTGSVATATFSYPSSVEWPSGTAPDGPAIGETDVLVFLTDDGGTSYQGFQAGDAMS